MTPGGCLGSYVWSQWQPLPIGPWPAFGLAVSVPAFLGESASHLRRRCRRLWVGELLLSPKQAWDSRGLGWRAPLVSGLRYSCVSGTLRKGCTSGGKGAPQNTGHGSAHPPKLGLFPVLGSAVLQEWGLRGGCLVMWGSGNLISLCLGAQEKSVFPEVLGSVTVPSRAPC